MVVLVAPVHPLRGGIADTTAAFAQSLIQQGQEVCVVSFTTLYPKIIFPGKTQYAADEKDPAAETSPLMGDDIHEAMGGSSADKRAEVAPAKTTTADDNGAYLDGWRL